MEVALISRGEFNIRKSKNIIHKTLYREVSNIDKSSLNYSDLDELISDKSITMNKKKSL